MNADRDSREGANIMRYWYKVDVDHKCDKIHKYLVLGTDDQVKEYCANREQAYQYVTVTCKKYKPEFMTIHNTDGRYIEVIAIENKPQKGDQDDENKL